MREVRLARPGAAGVLAWPEALGASARAGTGGVLAWHEALRASARRGAAGALACPTRQSRSDGTPFMNLHSE
jgi:hypothetical protein